LFFDPVKIKYYMKKKYAINIKFKNRNFKLNILPKSYDGFDLEMELKGSLSGQDFQELRKYLVDEGYVDAARSWNKGESYLAEEL
jgi:hypothetical protein